ncbi:MAG: substrate-binding domain-containing protein [Streptosporangiaceae bacterium]|nr:substrate-binding domain-containing protein [Streptosporangiaceae bacterium]MBV9853794.1 substrate-binding domain-containing protein [Streptosporangiaceae bacterium]
MAACSSSSGNSNNSGGGSSAGGQTSAVSSKYPWCGPRQASIALADGFGDNTWRELTRYSAVTVAAQCPSVTRYVYTNGEGNTQKAIGDINSLAAQGTTAIVDFPDAGEAMLPALTKAYQAGAIVVPYRVFPGGTAGQNYNTYISTDFTSAGVLWGHDVATALHGQGNVVFLGGPPANSQSLAEYQGLQSVFKSYPGIHVIGQKPYNVTNWDPALTQQVVASLLSKYPKIDAVVSDFGTALAASFPQFQKAGRKIPVIATEDGNSLGCDWASMHQTDPGFELFTVSSQTWMVEYAMRYAIALATKGKVPSSTVVPQQNFENSVTGSPNKPVCDQSLPATAIMSSGLTAAQQQAALNGAIPSLTSLR